MPYVILIKLLMLCIKISSYSIVLPKRSKDIRYKTKREELTQTEHITGSYIKRVGIFQDIEWLFHVKFKG